MFLILCPKSIYTRSVLLYLLLLKYWTTSDLPTIKHLHHNLFSFVEEDGELSFSVLSRTVLGDSYKSSFDSLNKVYQGQHLLLQSTTELSKDFGVFVTSLSNHPRIYETDEEVVILQQFLHQHLLNIELQTLKTYPPLGKNGFYPSLTPDKPTLEIDISTSNTVLPYLPCNLLLTAEDVLSDVHRLLVKNPAAGVIAGKVLRGPNSDELIDMEEFMQED